MATLIESNKDEALPKKKFKFERKVKAKKTVDPTALEAKKVIVTKTAAEVLAQSNDMAIKGQNGQHLVKTKEDYEGCENVIIEDCHECTIILPFPVKAVYMKNVTGSKFYIACTSGATFVDGAIDC